MKTLENIQNVNSNAANVASNNHKIDDFGQKIGGARKDLYQAAHEWAAQLADITAEALTKAGGVSKLVRLPNLESMAAAGAITADQARAALIIWRGIERKPQGIYKADRWAERTRARLEAAAAIITGTEPTADNVADIIRTARESAEFAVITAAQWPAVAFSFGKYSVIRCRYSNVPKLQIQDARYYRGTASEDPADIARQLREMVSRDEEQAADRRAAGPALGVYMNRAGVYYIAPADRSEIVLQTYEDRAAALKAYREDRPALVARYTALKNFPACRREWNRPRVGEDWRKGENMTPEKYAAVLPFRGVEFGNWVNQTERAALLNSAFDGFHDLAAVLNIAPAAVTLNGSLSFAFASRGHSGAAAHYEPARRVINLTKKSGAGCMAHEWWHAVDNFAAGGGIHNYATERRDHPRAFAILEAIKKTDYYRRSQNLAKFKGDYWTEGRELTARAFEGVAAVMLNAAGICSDFLVNCKSMDEFTAEDVARRSDYYPYPTADEAAALLPLYVAFLKEVFGDVLTAPAACYEEAKRAAARAELQRQEAERIAAERAEAERQERERKAAEMREKAAREAEERRQAAAHAVGLLRDVLTARHLDAIATAYDSATAYAVGHLEGEIYTISADIKTADTEGRAYIESRPAACIQYKRVHNAKRIICHRWQVAEIRANKWNARELCEALTESDARDIVRTFADFEKADTWQKAATLWADTQRLREAQSRRASEATEKPATGTKAAEGATTKPATADGLTMEKYSEKATVIRGYNADQLAELLAMGGKEWRNLKGGKGVIFSTRRHGDELAAWMEQQQGEGTTAPAAETTAPASAPADDQQGESVPAATLEPAQDITEPAAAGLPDWLRVGARVRTRGRFMMTTRSRRPQWVEGEEMTVKAINADFVELENRDESGTLRGLESVATATAADDLTPIYSASEKLGEAVREWSANEYAATHHGATLTDWDKAHPAPMEWCKPGQVFKLAGRQIAGRDVYAIITKLGNDCFFYVGNFGSCSEHLTAYNCQQWENLQPVEIMHEDTPKFAKMFQKFHDIRKAWEADGVKIWQEREDKERTAAPLQEPAAIAASIDTDEPETPADASEEPAEVISTPTRAKSLTYQDQPDPDTLPADLPAELLKFYEVNRDASDENPAPVCLFYEPGVKKYQAFGSDAHLLAQEFGAAVITFTEGTEYRHGATFPHAIDFADFPAAELSDRLHWLTREGYAVAVFAAADCLPTLNPAAPDWQERDRARRDRRYSETLELGDGVTRVMESERNMYDFHYDLYYRYYKGGDMLAMFHATGYPEKWDYIGTIRPPHAGRFSNGAMVEHFATIWQAERFMLAEIKAGGLTPYRRREATDTKQAEPLRIEITREEIDATQALYSFAADTLRTLRETNPESINPADGCAYVWSRQDIDKAADALSIDRAALFGWCYDNSDFITTRVIIRAAIALSSDSPAPSQAHRLFEWSFIEERAAEVAPSYDTNQDTATLYKSSEITDLPASEYGDLCYDYFGKGSVIVFGNTDDHRAQLEAIGGKYSDRLKYSPLQNGRKWTEKQGRTAGYYFTTEKGKEQAVKYVQRVNHSLFDKYEQTAATMGDRIQKREDLKEGDRVRTIHGLGTVTAHEPKYNARVSVVVRLDKFTYNYGWKGMPQTFIECRCDEVALLQELSEIKAADIVSDQEQHPQNVHTSWATDFTPEDFEKLTSRYEVAEEDRDIIGQRFHTGEGLWTIDVFVSDYAGNEAHALIFMLTGEGEVRANVLSLDHLRRTLTEAKGWTRIAA